MDYLAELQKIEKQSNDAKIQKAKMEQKLTTLEEEQKKLQAELVVWGVTEETLEEELQSLGEDIEITIQDAKALFQ